MLGCVTLRQHPRPRSVTSVQRTFDLGHQGGLVRESVGRNDIPGRSAAPGTHRHRGARGRLDRVFHRVRRGLRIPHGRAIRGEGSHRQDRSRARGCSVRRGRRGGVCSARGDESHRQGHRRSDERAPHDQRLRCRHGRQLREQQSPAGGGRFRPPPTSLTDRRSLHTNLVSKPATQSLKPVVERAWRCLKCRREFLTRQPLDGTEHENFEIAGVQGSKKPIDPRRRLRPAPALGVHLRTVPQRLMFVDSSPLEPAGIAADPSGDPVQPGSLTPAWQVVPSAKRHQERILNRIVNKIGSHTHAAHRRPHEAVVVLVERAKSSHLSPVRAAFHLHPLAVSTTGRKSGNQAKK